MKKKSAQRHHRLLDAVAAVDVLQEKLTMFSAELLRIRASIFDIESEVFNEVILDAIKALGDGGADSMQIRDKIEDSKGVRVSAAMVRVAITTLRQRGDLVSVSHGRYERAWAEQRRSHCRAAKGKK
jgi:hypothetical protein